MCKWWGWGWWLRCILCLISLKIFFFPSEPNTPEFPGIVLFLFLLHLAEAAAALIHLEIIHHWSNVCAWPQPCCLAIEMFIWVKDFLLTNPKTTEYLSTFYWVLDRAETIIHLCVLPSECPYGFVINLYSFFDSFWSVSLQLFCNERWNSIGVPRGCIN